MTESLFLTLLILATTWLFCLRRTVQKPGVLFCVSMNTADALPEQAERMLTHYRIATGTAAVAALLGVALLPGRLAPLMILPVPLVAQVAFLWGRSILRPLAAPVSSRRSASLAQDNDDYSRKGFLLILPYLFLVLPLLWTATHWDDAPLSIPVHWGLTAPDRWEPRSWSALFPLFLGGLFALLMTHLMWLIPFRSRHGLTRIPFRAVLPLMLGVAIPVGLTLLPQLVHAVPAPLPLAFPACLLPALVLTIQAFLSQEKEEHSEEAGDLTEDGYWKWGLFYVNPGDGALFVRKRMGFGLTLNFGNPFARLFLLGIVLFALFSLLSHC